MAIASPGRLHWCGKRGKIHADILAFWLSLATIGDVFQEGDGRGTLLLYRAVALLLHL